MPKLKTHKGAQKRFKVTAKKKVLHKKANKSHILTKKASKRKRHLGKKARGQQRRPQGPSRKCCPTSSSATRARRRPCRESNAGPRDETAGSKSSTLAKGYLGRQELQLPHRQGGGREVPALRLPRPAGQASGISAASGSSGSRPAALVNGLTYSRFINGPEEARTSSSTARSWPTWPSTPPRPSAASPRKPKMPSPSLDELKDRIDGLRTTFDGGGRSRSGDATVARGAAQRLPQPQARASSPFCSRT